MKCNVNTKGLTAPKQWAKLTDTQLIEAAQLMIAPEWLRERGAIIALLKNFDFTAGDVADVLVAGEPLNNGPQLIL